MLQCLVQSPTHPCPPHVCVFLRYSLLANSCPGLESLTYYSTTNSNLAPKSTGHPSTATHTLPAIPTSQHFPSIASSDPPAPAIWNNASSWLQLSSLQSLTELDLELEYETTRLRRKSVDLGMRGVGAADGGVDDSAASGIPARKQRGPGFPGVSGLGRRLSSMNSSLGGGGDVEEAGSLAEVVSVVVKLPWLRKLRLASDSMHMEPDCQVRGVGTLERSFVAGTGGEVACQQKP